MKAAILERPAAPAAVDATRLREVILVRAAAGGARRAELASDLAPYAPARQPATQWRAAIDREVAALIAAGLASAAGARIEATPAGAARVAAFLGRKGEPPRQWSEARDVHLTARALGLQRQPVKRLRALATPAGLNAEIVQRAYKLDIKGVATPSRLRVALAAVALQRAFGHKLSAGLAGKTGLSPKAQRLLAAQLSKKPRKHGTDARLIAALAAEHVGATSADDAAVRAALLRGFIAAGAEKPAPKRARPAEPARQALQLVAAPPAPPQVRPDLAGFAAEVRRHAEGQAEGWIGNRRAYISRVWRAIRDRHAGWGLSEIEFKCMLAEAHRAGALALANADLKDNSSITDLQKSAVTYKNAVFHFIRVDA